MLRQASHVVGWPKLKGPPPGPRPRPTAVDEGVGNGGAYTPSPTDYQGALRVDSTTHRASPGFAWLPGWHRPRRSGTSQGVIPRGAGPAGTQARAWCPRTPDRSPIPVMPGPLPWNGDLDPRSIGTVGDPGR